MPPEILLPVAIYDFQFMIVQTTAILVSPLSVYRRSAHLQKRSWIYRYLLVLIGIL